MSFDYQKTLIAGRLVADPEARSFEGGRSLAKFSVASNYRFRVGDESREEVTFLDVEVWGRQAELVTSYLHQGSGVFVEGRLRQNTWTDKDGLKRSRLVLVASLVRFTDSKSKTSGGEGGEESAGPITVTGDDEPPF